MMYRVIAKVYCNLFVHSGIDDKDVLSQCDDIINKQLQLFLVFKF